MLGNKTLGIVVIMDSITKTVSSTEYYKYQVVLMVKEHGILEMDTNKQVRMPPMQETLEIKSYSTLQ